MCGRLAEAESGELLFRKGSGLPVPLPKGETMPGRCKFGWLLACTPLLRPLPSGLVDGLLPGILATAASEKIPNFHSYTLRFGR